MPDFRTIYAQHAAEYEALVAREDYAGNLLPAIRNACPPENTHGLIEVVELGAGTGRVTRLIAPHVRTVRAFDASPAMLKVAAETLRPLGQQNWSLAAGLNDRLPLPAACTDLAVAGWSIGHTIGWHPDDWPARVRIVLAEMARVLRPGGVSLIIETLGTGFENPTPPPVLIPYYDLLRDEGFASAWIRTDYRFASQAEAEQVAGFFFGPDMAAQIARNGWVTLPECTGLWWRKH